jgi:hypothetical protein
MGKTIRPGQMGDPQMRIGFSKKGGMRFLKVGKGNPEAIKAQQQKLASCAKSAAGLKGAAFKAKVKSCASR